MTMPHLMNCPHSDYGWCLTCVKGLFDELEHATAPTPGLLDRMAFSKELQNLINSYSRENGSDTPDFILSEYLVGCLEAFDKAVKRRTKWYSEDK